jgi:diadenosine tetraphosphatase ApaH/serine/threonine PP2A family protein phosphatase
VTRFALISDLHSNLPALEAVFRRIDELAVAEVNCLGDVIGYGAEPDPCVRLVMDRCKWTLQGNHDWGLFHDPTEFNPLASEALAYTRKLLRPTIFTPRRRGPWHFLRDLPDRMVDHGYLFFHGSPRDPVMEYVLRTDEHFDPEKLVENFKLIDRPAFVGHTHYPGITRADLHFTPATNDERIFELKGPCIVNVGSVGQPRDGDPRASFAVVADDKVEIHRVPYDYHKTQAKILSAGLHPALADRLGRGK